MLVYLQKHDVFYHISVLELSREDWIASPRLPASDPVLALYLLESLVSYGGNIYAENSKGYSPLSLIKDATLKADMVYLTRRPLLLFLEAVCVADELTNNKSFRRVAENSDLTNFIVGFL